MEIDLVRFNFGLWRNIISKVKAIQPLCEAAAREYNAPTFANWLRDQKGPKAQSFQGALV